MFPSGKPLSGHHPADKPLKTIKGHLERDLATSYHLISYEACPSLLGIITRIPKKPPIRHFLKFLKENSVIAGNPAETITRARKEEKDPAVLFN